MPGSLVKSYVTDVDYALDATSSTTLAKSTFWAIKAALKKEILTTNSGAITAWTCEGSGDATTGALDGTDRLGATFDATKWTRNTAGSAHTWIVLKNAGLGLWLTLDYVGTTDQNISIYVSTVLPTGGTNTARPSSTNEVTVMSNHTFVPSTTAAARAHRVFNSDGYFTIGFSQNGSGLIHTVFALQPVTETRASDPQAWVAIHDSGYAATTAALLYSSIGSSSTGAGWRGTSTHCIGFLANGTTSILLVPSFWASNSGAIFQGQTLTGVDGGDSKYDDMPMYMLSISATVGIKGSMYDWRLTGGPASGDIFPAAVPSMTHLCIGQCWVPWTAVPTL